MQTRRSLLGVCGAALAAGVAGCADAVPTTFEASPARVSGETLTATGYEELETFAETITPADFGVDFDVDALPVEAEDIEVTNEVAIYGKEVSLGGIEQTGAFAGVVSSPRMVIEGQPLNPIGSWDVNQLIGEFVPRLEAREEIGGIRDVTEEGQQTTTVLGSERTVTRFEAVGELQQFDQEVDVVLHTTDTITAGEDFVLASGGYPEELADTEEAALFDLFGGIDYPV